MRVRLASEPGSPDRPNEDFAAVTPSAAVLLDGATVIPPDTDSGCVHGVAWYARALGTALLAEITAEPPGPLPRALGAAISHVRSRHHGTCNLANPASPAATVIAVRRAATGLDYLAMSDSIIAFDWTDSREPLIVMDQRRPASRYAARADPAAARNALTGTLPLTALRGVALLSDGASCLADRYHLLTWPAVLALIGDHGPGEMIRQVRAAEASDPQRTRWPRDKASDDATVIYWQITD